MQVFVFFLVFGEGLVELGNISLINSAYLSKGTNSLTSYYFHNAIKIYIKGLGQKTFNSHFYII